MKETYHRSIWNGHRGCWKKVCARIFEKENDAISKVALKLNRAKNKTEEEDWRTSVFLLKMFFHGNVVLRSCVNWISRCSILVQTRNLRRNLFVLKDQLVYDKKRKKWAFDQEVLHTRRLCLKAVEQMYL